MNWRSVKRGRWLSAHGRENRSIVSPGLGADTRLACSKSCRTYRRRWAAAYDDAVTRHVEVEGCSCPGGVGERLRRPRDQSTDETRGNQVTHVHAPACDASASGCLCTSGIARRTELLAPSRNDRLKSPLA